MKDKYQSNIHSLSSHKSRSTKILSFSKRRALEYNLSFRFKRIHHDSISEIEDKEKFYLDEKEDKYDEKK